jgi:hypothetical protein
LQHRVCYGLAGAGDACDTAAYFGSFACFRMASYNFFIAVKLA